jgi:hypothetical protein
MTFALRTFVDSSLFWNWDLLSSWECKTARRLELHQLFMKELWSKIPSLAMWIDVFVVGSISVAIGKIATTQIYGATKRGSSFALSLAA